ncbi:MAG: hypothetical protein H6R15_1607 [Proteobacteria bacterium]|nr:hypothetical protein [Pseudomonadota bacterium]
MKARRQCPKQGGFVLWLLVFALTVGAGYAIYRTANARFSDGRADSRLAAQLVQAKAALIARAVTDANRPGSLPCPDLVTTSAGLYNFPGDGKADMLAGNHCPSYVGWLPWLTLDLPELQDDTGTRLWYALSPSLRDDDSAQPINSTTPMALEVDGRGDIAAIVMAAGAPLAGQLRPSNQIADYLDGGNGQHNGYRSGPPGPDFNDRLLVITRQELMAAVDKRIAGEVLNCLERHADAPANAGQRYPWAAPLAAGDGHGKSGSRFGRLPATQPGAGAAAALKENLAQMAQVAAQLGSGDASQQLARLTGLRDLLVQARNLSEVIFLTSNRLKQAADSISEQLLAIDSTIAAAAGDGQISPAEGSAIRRQSQSGEASLDSLPELLGEFGADPFPQELARRNAVLGMAETPGQLLAGVAEISRLLAASSTPRHDLATALAASQQAAQAAQRAALAATAESADAARLATAKAATEQLLASTTSLGGALQASRVNVLAQEIADYASLLETLNAALADDPAQQNATALLAGLDAASQRIAEISSGQESIVTTQAQASAALLAARQAARAAPADYAGIGAATSLAIAQTRALVGSIADNENNDNNLSRTSVLAALRTYRTARDNFTALDGTPSDLLPYATSLGEAAGMIAQWTQIIAASASRSAPLAMADPVTRDRQAAEASVLPDSAYRAAANALSSIDEKKGSGELLQAAIDHPDSDYPLKAASALAATGDQLATLLTRQRTLADSLSTTTASAQPLVWLSARCDFLLPGRKSWWNDNQWAPTLFFQIGNPLKAVPGSLWINGQGPYRLVALAAGPALPQQNRDRPTVANFLEGQNADPSRDGAASAPSNHFSARAPRSDFNDRIAY